MKIAIAIPCSECGCDSSHTEPFQDGRIVVCDNCDHTGPKGACDFFAI